MHAARRALFLSHGGGPLPLLGDPSHREMVACLQRIAGSIARPTAIVLVSAHWEAPTASVTAGAHPALIYDYGGFPPESYDIRYPCPGNPPLAAAIVGTLDTAGIAATAAQDRGFDHGLFVPMKIMFPEADIPCVQVSLINGLDPAAHIALGRALQGVADPSVLLVGSGFSYHNMRGFFTPDTEQTRAANLAFEHWLLETCADAGLSEDARTARLLDWAAAPSARHCHPREEHLLPLHLCYGYAGTAASKTYELSILNKRSSMYLWEVGG